MLVGVAAVSPVGGSGAASAAGARMSAHAVAIASTSTRDRATITVRVAVSGKAAARGISAKPRIYPVCAGLLVCRSRGQGGLWNRMGELRCAGALLLRSALRGGT